jgi:hypothetical protein
MLILIAIRFNSGPIVKITLTTISDPSTIPLPRNFHEAINGPKDLL